MLPCRRVRVFAFRTGKLTRIYDESLEAANDLQRGDAEMFKLDPIDFGRRMAVEKDLQSLETPQQTNAVFDESGNFLIYPTLLGIKAGGPPNAPASPLPRLPQASSGVPPQWVCRLKTLALRSALPGLGNVELE